jgi:hypothetical protein
MRSIDDLGLTKSKLTTMKKSIQITIPEPCHEDWAKMTLSQNGKHCAVCEKEVIDFTKATDEQLYKTAKNGGNLCGRFTKNQLDRPIQLQRKQGRSWASYAASLLIPATMLATQEIMAQGEIRSYKQTEGNYTSLGISSLSRNRTSEIHDHRESEALKQTKKDTIKKSNPYTIKGMISDQTESLPGATVHIKGTEKVAKANLDGKYLLEVSEGDVLIFEYIGYRPIEITVDKKTKKILNITLDAYPVRTIMMGRPSIIQSDNTPH